MKMRQLKQYHVAQILWRNWFNQHYASLRLSSYSGIGPLVEVFREAAGIEAAKVDPMITEFLSGPSVHSIMAVEAAKVEFVCVKVSDGSVVDTFDTREDAQDLVDKHVRGKKAKLEILETA